MSQFEEFSFPFEESNVYLLREGVKFAGFQELEF